MSCSFVPRAQHPHSGGSSAVIKADTVVARGCRNSSHRRQRNFKHLTRQQRQCKASNGVIHVIDSVIDSRQKGTLKTGGTRDKKRSSKVPPVGFPAIESASEYQTDPTSGVKSKYENSRFWECYPCFYFVFVCILYR